MPKTISFKVFIIVVVSILSIGGYFVSREKSVPKGVMTVDDLTKIESIRSYISSISDDFTKDVQALAKENKVPSWGCGPSSYALAQLINRKFFANDLMVDVLYDNEPYEVIERFGLVEFVDGKEKTTGDHAWVEVYIKNKILFIDPTIAQYGKVSGIAFEAFNVGDPSIKSILKDKYGVIDNRVTILLRKVLNKIPIDQPPYPGMGIDPNYLAYFKNVVELRNTVSIGREPDSWSKWTDYLVGKYNPR